MLQRILVTALLAPLLLLTGCSWTRDLIKSDKVDYKSQGQAAKADGTAQLEVPPDLTQPTANDRYRIPGDGSARRVESVSEQAQRPRTAAVPTNTVLPDVKGMSIERGGSQRWLVVGGKPDQHWQSIKEFWQELGFVISIERPEAGVMETDWAENRAKIGTDFLRNTIGKVVDSLYSTPERDKFRTRLEVNANGQTEIYISHRGMIEIYKNEAREQTVWQPRPADPELEAEFLRRLMVRLGNDEAAAKPVAAGGNALGAGSREPERAKLVKEGQYTQVVVDDSFDRAWRRVGLALDRVGFTVEDRDRSKGLFFVRYADPDSVNQKKTEGGFLSKFTNFFNTDKSVPAELYQIQVSGADPATRVVVLSKAGSPEETQTSRRILSLLHEQLK